MNTIKTKMNLSELKHPEKNIRKHPQKQITEMKRSIQMFGQFRPVVIDENNVIMAGNGLAIALRELGIEEVEVIQYMNLTENQKKKLMIADNQVASLGVDDYGAIEELLRSLEGDIDVPGYDEDTLKLLVEEAGEIAQEVAMNYGVYPTEEVERLKAVERDRAENGIQPVERPEQPAPVYTSQPAPAAAYTQPEPVTMAAEHIETQQPQRYVTCPHCGEKIYL